MAELLLLPSAGVAGVVALSAGAIVEGVVAAGGAGVAGGGVLSVLLQAESTSAAAIALRANFVFIDNPQKLFENRPTECRAQHRRSNAQAIRTEDSIASAAYFKLGLSIECLHQAFNCSDMEAV
jgi:hypothetical protein